MTQSNFGNPNQYEVEDITIAGQSVIGLFFSLSIYENVYTPCVTGNITMIDSDGAGFIEEQRIEFVEEIEFSFKNANGDTLEFKGVLNGLRNEATKDSLKYYTIDFTSESVRRNEEQFVVKAFKDTNPGDIVSEMVQLLGGQVDNAAGQGLPMNYIGSRRRPVDVIKYVLTHGVSNKSQATEQEGQSEEEASGTTGYMCWETLRGFKFDTVDNVTSGQAGTRHRDYTRKAVNQNLAMDDLMKTIVNVEFKQIGDFQTKLRSGAFGAKNVSFDMDKGEYKEYLYYNGENMTDKMKVLLPEGSITRFTNKVYSNQKFQAPNQCQPSQPATGDQSRRYLNQNIGRQNSYSDQTGEFTLYPQFNFSAGDVFECKMRKVKDDDGEKADGGIDRKHSGQYIINQVGHHFFQDGTAYTAIKTNRSTIQQDDSSSRRS